VLNHLPTWVATSEKTISCYCPFKAVTTFALTSRCFHLFTSTHSWIYVLLSFLPSQLSFTKKSLNLLVNFVVEFLGTFKYKNRCIISESQRVSNVTCLNTSRCDFRMLGILIQLLKMAVKRLFRIQKKEHKALSQMYSKSSAANKEQTNIWYCLKRWKFWWDHALSHMKGNVSQFVTETPRISSYMSKLILLFKCVPDTFQISYYSQYTVSGNCI